MNEELVELLQALPALQQGLARALASGDDDLVAELWGQVRAVEERRDQLLATATSGRAAISSRQKSPKRPPVARADERGAEPVRRSRTKPSSGRTSSRAGGASASDEGANFLMVPGMGVNREGKRLRAAERTWLPAAPGAQERPMREVVLEALHLVGRPIAVPLLRDIVRVRDDVDLPTARLASLRRDEERSYRSAATRPAYVVPALTFDRFTAVRGVLASSVFPLPIRLIAPASSRVDFLHTVMGLADDFEALRRLGTPRAPTGGSGPAIEDAIEAPGDTVDTGPERYLVQQGVEPETATDRALRPYALLLARLARTVPGAMSGTGSTSGAGGWIDVAQIHAAAAAELAVLADEDTVDREAAAERARAQLDVATQLFGSKPRVISNSAADRRKEA
ncbi:hypothetical protein ACI799_01530 [Blastococcus sp. SYSU DS0753]